MATTKDVHDAAQRAIVIHGRVYSDAYDNTKRRPGKSILALDVGGGLFVREDRKFALLYPPLVISDEEAAQKFNLVEVLATVQRINASLSACDD